MLVHAGLIFGLVFFVKKRLTVAGAVLNYYYKSRSSTSQSQQI